MWRYLRSKSHEVTSVNSVEDAHEQLVSADFDLLILDWELPDGNGPDICKDYRDRGGLAAVLMLTGRSGSDDKVTGLNAGADDYLVKPFVISEFSARVDALLRRLAMHNKKPEPKVFDESLLGKTFAGNYAIEAVLGKGAMGFVFKASHRTLKRTAAIKVLSERNLGPVAKKRFEREARAMSLLDHPNLSKIYEFGFAEETPYIVMELLEGAALYDVLRNCGPLPVQEAIPLFTQICDGLEHAHAQKLIHRDLKPANIIISSDGRNAKVVDLGLVKFMQPEEDLGAGNNATLSHANEVMGSPAYMSPEQGSNRQIDQRTDVYALGCVMYETLSGQICFKGTSFFDIIQEKMSSKAPSICEEFPHMKFPVEMDRCIRKALEPNQTKRYSTMSELKADLLLVPLSDDKKESKLLSYVRGFLGKRE